MSHTTDWFPGRVTREYQQGWERIFGGKLSDKEQVDAALKYFKQDACCGGNCDCSNRKRED